MAAPPMAGRKPRPGDEDDTVVLARPGRRRAAGLISLVVALGLAAIAIALVLLQRQTPGAQVAALPLAAEAAIAAEQPQTLTLFRFASNPRILVMDFPTLRQQGLMFNRIAVFAEKSGAPHDRVLDDAALNDMITTHGDTTETFYYGHDYDSATLARFFATAASDGVTLNAEEQRLHALAREQGMLAADACQAVITVPRASADSRVDDRFRRAILHHELSHGEFFTSPAYAAYVRHFWNGVLDAPLRATFTRFLVAQEYDSALPDLMANETQAYLMYTPDTRIFSAALVGLTPDSISTLRTEFLRDMPAGWLRDATSVPVEQ